MSEFVMEVEKVEEAGYISALKGLAHNKKQSTEKMVSLAAKLAFSDGGHNKFLESIVVWLEVRGPRYFWQEADTFRLSTKQSESTMHTLITELGEIDIEDVAAVEAFINDNFEAGSCSAEVLRSLYEAAQSKDIVSLKKLLPEGFLQRRLWCLSYKTLRNIILQRRSHRLPHWKSFIVQVLEQVDHRQLLPGLKSDRAKTG